MKKLILIKTLLIIILVLPACGTNGADVERAYEVCPIYETYNEYKSHETYEQQELHSEPYPEQVPEQSEEPVALTPLAIEALHLVELVEAVHPIFIIEGMLPDNYEAIRDEFLSYTVGPIGIIEFAFAIQRFFTVLQDGHMANRINMTGSFLNVSWIANSDGLFLVDGMYTVAEVIYIGGVPVPDVFAQVDRHYFAENEADRLWLHALHSRDRIILSMAGAEVGAQVELTLLCNNGEQQSKAVNFSSMTATEGGGYTWQPEYIIRYEVIDGIFYISLREFRFHQPYHNQTVEAIKRAVAGGARKFIVDLRGNPGGNSVVGQELLEAMGITVPSHGAYRRISDLALAQRPWLQYFAGEDWIFHAPNSETASNPNDVFVMTLTDALTYSSATMFGTWVQDGGFGAIMGQPSRNSPSMFGDMLNYRLPISGFNISISHTRFLRPDPYANQYVLYPDFFAHCGTDINVDAVLAFAVEILNDMPE